MKNINKKELMKIIKMEGIENIRFNIPMKPIHKILGIAYSTSTDEDVIVPCKISTERYNPLEGYKITMESLIKGFGRDHYYLSDFVNLIRKGVFEIRGYR